MSRFGFSKVIALNTQQLAIGTHVSSLLRGLFQKQIGIHSGVHLLQLQLLQHPFLCPM